MDVSTGHRATGGRSALTSLPSAFLASATNAPDQVALRSFGSDEQLSLAKWAARARAVAGGLASLGVGRGDRVALLLRTRIEFHLVDMGALLLGAIPFSLYATAAVGQLCEILDNARPTVLITEAALLEKARAVRSSWSGLGSVVVVDGPVADEEISLAAVEAACPADFDAEASAARIRREDICTLIYTSGTTGSPKGVQFRHGAMLTCLDSIRKRYPTIGHDRAISYLPMAHIADRVFAHYAAFVYGYEVTSLGDPTQLGAALAAVRPTRFFGVPRTFEKVLAGLHRAIEASADRDRLRAELDARLARGRAGQPVDAGAGTDPLRPLVEATGLDQAYFLAVAGAPSSMDVLEELTAFGLPVNEFYGTSEVLIIAGSPPGAIRLGTVGTPLDQVQVRLAEDGEVLVGGPTVMPGYFRDPQRTAEVLDDEGWLHTGDVGSLDDGYLRIVDRKKALIINSSGKNMSPANIEQAIKGGHPLIAQVFVVGDRRPYNVALIVLDRDGVADLARKNHLADAPFEERAAHADVLAAAAAAVDAGNQRLSRVEQIKRFRVLDHDWAPGSELLTPTAKLKRAQIQQHYHDLIEELYA